MESEQEVGSGRLESHELAALIVDALLRAELLKKDDVTQALAIVTEEIEVRKILEDY